MNDEKKGFFEELWEKKDLSVADMINEMKTNDNLKFLVGSVGTWYVCKKIFQLIVLINLMYFIYHMFVMVLS